MKTIHFISGLPRSGSTMIANILKQNPKIHGESVSSLASLFGSINSSWDQMDPNKEYPNLEAKKGVLKSILQGYYSHINKPIIFDKDRNWICLIPLLEHVLEQRVKIVACVRNPAEILSSFEKLRKSNPLFYTKADRALNESSSIISRCFYYAEPDGPLGISHRHLHDAITMGYLDRLLFVDYNTFCNKPKSQTERIYDFFELEKFDHDFKNIVQTEQYNYHAIGLDNLHTVRPEVMKNTINCVEYLGLELYEQYNKEIFWNAWI